MTRANFNTHPYMDGEAKGRFWYVAILNQECCQWKEHPKKRSWDTFLLEIGDLTKSALFGGTTLCPSGAVL